MNKILIVNNNMEVGGIQKSLLNLLKELAEEYDISIAFFSESGELYNSIPEKIKIVQLSSIYKVLGLSKSRLKKSPFLFITKAVCKIATPLFGKRNIIKILGIFQKKIVDYDVVISYTHLTDNHTFDVGTAEFVIDKTSFNQKICFIHCDYKNSGFSSEYNNRFYSLFDKIACCSDSVKNRLLEMAPELSGKTYTQRNFYDLSVVDCMGEEPIQYNNQFITIVVVARLSVEKGILRFLRCIRETGRIDYRIYLIGDGPERGEIESFVENNNMHDMVSLKGEQSNPYKYMKNADYLAQPSYHEAAPVVFDEAKALGLSVISSNTLSAVEMLGENDIIFKDDEELCKVLSVLEKPKKIMKTTLDNQLQIRQFSELVDKNN